MLPVKTDTFVYVQHRQAKQTIKTINIANRNKKEMHYVRLRDFTDSPF